MKSIIQTSSILLIIILLFSASIIAQTSWRVGGNNNAASIRLGMNTNFDMFFETNGIDRGILQSDGDWGIGTVAPAAQLHINSGAAEDALRVQVNGSTKLLVDDLGGLSVGTLTAAPANGLLVSGDATMSSTLEVLGTLNLGSVENLYDGGSFVIFTNSNFSHEDDNADGLGSSSNRWVDLWAVDGTINTSDAREKSNIQNINYGIADLMKLRPVSFSWKSNPERGTKLGLIAQELQQVIPEVVRDWEYKTDEVTGEKVKVPSARLGVMYDDLLAVLIKSIQDQQGTIQDLERRLAVLETTASKSVSSNDVVAQTSLLEQNIPNPFTGSTTIRFERPLNATDVRIQITDQKGQIIKMVETAGNEITIQSGELAAGTYYYTLVVDRMQMETKKMTIAR